MLNCASIYLAGLISTILEVMKPQIAAGSKGVPTAYGEVLFRAWKDTAAAAGGAKNNGVNTSEVCYAIICHIKCIELY